MSDELDDLKMDELRAIGEPLGLSFGPGVSKAHARAAIKAARDATPDIAVTTSTGLDVIPPASTTGAPDATVTITHPAPPAPKGAREIVRVGHSGAWWCPHCDHCSPKTAEACGGCGATRNDNQAVL